MVALGPIAVSLGEIGQRFRIAAIPGDFGGVAGACVSAREKGAAGNCACSS